ncbi:putative 30S ribosomal protein S5 [Methylococcus capsulatus]|uniref:30S ribosomal protein S5 n=1 Tax=Methylococcus capsulatus TaxID=414 RepID=A0AA35UGG5_METCP|nr:putative 30S ribosomal protein S5 [Methylococcus capsulatus]
MTDQEHRALELTQQLFQQLQCFQVEVVGGLVQHQDVTRLAEQAGQQHPVLLPAGETAHGCAGAFRGKQEIAEVGHDVDLLAIQADPFFAVAYRLDDGLVGIELGAQLIEISDLEMGAGPDRSRIGLQLPQQQPQQGRLAGTVRADEAHPVAAQHQSGKILDHRHTTEGDGEMFDLEHQLTAALGLFQLEPGDTLPRAALCTLAAHPLQRPHPAFVAGPPRLDALADPCLLDRQLAVELGIALLFFLQRRRLLRQVVPVITGPGGQLAAVQIDDAGGHPLQEGAVMGDEHDGAGELEQLLLQPDDGFEVEMVGGLVQEQQIRLDDQGAGQRDPALPAPGQPFDRFFTRQSETAEHEFHPPAQTPAICGFQRLLQDAEPVQTRGVTVREPFGQVVVFGDPPAGLAQTIGHGVVDRRGGRQRRHLLEEADPQPGLLPDFAAVGRELPRQDFQQSRLTFAVAADDTDPLARIDLKMGSFEQGFDAEGDTDIRESNERHDSDCAKEERPPSITAHHSVRRFPPPCPSPAPAKTMHFWPTTSLSCAAASATAPEGIWCPPA